jgi:hypothetical protein
MYFSHIEIGSHSKVITHFFGFDILTAVILKSAVFRDVTPCIPAEVLPVFTALHRSAHLFGRGS